MQRDIINKIKFIIRNEFGADIDLRESKQFKYHFVDQFIKCMVDLYAPQVAALLAADFANKREFLNILILKLNTGQNLARDIMTEIILDLLFREREYKFVLYFNQHVPNNEELSNNYQIICAVYDICIMFICG